MIQLILPIDSRIQDYILDEMPQDASPRPRPRPRHEAPSYRVEVSSGADFVATKTFRGKDTLLALIVSQRQFYVRGSGTVKELTPKLLRDWCNAPEIHEAITPAWSDASLNAYSADACFNLVRLLAVPTFCELLKRDLVRVEAETLARVRFPAQYAEAATWEQLDPLVRVLVRKFTHDVVREGISRALRVVPLGYVFSEDVPVRAVLENAEQAVELLGTIGPDNFGKILDAISTANANLAPLHDVVFHTNRVVALLRAGTAHADHAQVSRKLATIIAESDEPARDLDQLGRYLSFQLEVRDGRLTTPFPRDLDAATRELVAEREAKINDEHRGIARRAEALEPDSYEDRGYIIRPIRTACELIDESRRMGNCLESYIYDYETSRCELWVMRIATKPDTPHIDIEIRSGRVRQAFRRYNRHLSESEWRLVDEWAQLRDIEPCSRRNRPLAAPQR